MVSQLVRHVLGKKRKVAVLLSPTLRQAARIVMVSEGGGLDFRINLVGM